jgi:hypothetical protein
MINFFKKLFVNVIASLIISYICGIISEANFNIVNWSPDTRYFCSIVFVVGLIFISLRDDVML